MTAEPTACRRPGDVMVMTLAARTVDPHALQLPLHWRRPGST